MRLRVGIIDETPGWQLLLFQEGVSFSKIQEKINPDDYSAIIAGRNINSHHSDQLREYLKNGGSVLCTADFYEQLTGKASKQQHVRYLYPSAQTLFSESDIIDINADCFLPSNANELLTEQQQPAVYVGTFGKGHIIVLPFDAGDLILDHRAVTKSFFARRSRLPFERVSTVAKNGIRRLVARSLELLYHKRGLPYVHRWYYPRDARNIFSFRIDTDYGSRREIKELFEFLSDPALNVSASWFVDVQSQRQWLDEYASMKGQEIGLHCYEHKQYEDYQAASRDIRTAMDCLKETPIHVKGCASPYGSWNPGIGKAINEQGFDYSSEFSYDYDNVPSFPYVGNRFSDAAQIPVHPISIGSLRRQGCSEMEMKQYFITVIEQKMLTREPLCFYHHPKNHHESVLEEMFRKTRSYGIQNLTMGEYACWWKKRRAVQDSITMNNTAISVETVNRADDVWLHLTKQDGTEAFTASKDSVSLDGLSWNVTQKPHSFSQDKLKTRAFNPWIPLIKFEDMINSCFRR